MTEQLARMTDLVVQWADGVAPNRRPQDAMVKLVSENSELLDAIVNNLGPRQVEEELADCVILLLDLANMYGVNIERAVAAKMRVNQSRDWTNEGGVIRRVRTNGHQG